MEGGGCRSDCGQRRYAGVECEVPGLVHVRLLADDKFVNARRFKSYDDFEEMAIHSTILIDKEGRVHWARHGAGPFTDYDFLLAVAADERSRGESLAGSALVGAAEVAVRAASTTRGWSGRARRPSDGCARRA